ncbi:hypothetical protein Hamer_G029604, partial [Homarus americanus]
LWRFSHNVMDTVRLWVKRYKEEGHAAHRAPTRKTKSHHTSGRSTDSKGSRASTTVNCHAYNEGNRSSVSPNNYQEANTGDWPTMFHPS